MAEAETSAATAVLTLTYAPRSDLADKVLTPKHFQSFMKLLRRSGHKVRYLVAGEYGDSKGRTHFHAILFFKHPPVIEGEGPAFYNRNHLLQPETSARFTDQIPQKEMVHVREWPHGHILVDWTCTHKSVRYVVKYLLVEDKARAWFSLSKKPAIGYEFFQRKAALARELGTLPSTFNYLPPGARDKTRYLMTGATRRDFLNAITQDESLVSRMSDWCRKTFEKHHRQRIIEMLESQPLEVLQQAWDDQREARDDQERLQRTFRQLAQTADDQDLLDQSRSGILRKHEGRWVPQEWIGYYEQTQKGPGTSRHDNRPPANGKALHAGEISRSSSAGRHSGNSS